MTGVRAQYVRTVRRAVRDKKEDEKPQVLHPHPLKHT